MYIKPNVLHYSSFYFYFSLEAGFVALSMFYLFVKGQK